MKIHIRQKVMLAVSFSIIIVVALGIASFLFINKMIEASRRSAHAQLVLYETERIRSAIAEIQREFNQNRVPDDSTNTARQPEAHRALMNNMATIDSLTSDNKYQQHRIDTLNTIIAEIISNGRSMEFNAAPFRIANNMIDEIQNVEMALKRVRQGIVTRQFYNFIKASLGLLIVWISIMVTLLMVLNKNLRARENAEANLKYAASEIFDLYSNAPCGYFTINHDGIVVSINQTLLNWLGYDKQGIVDRVHIEDIMGKEESALVKELLNNKDRQKVGYFETSLQRHDLSRIPVGINFSSVPDRKGNVHYRCSVIDNTARKHAEQEIRQANKELESFTYSVSHDLRAPLRSINGYAEILMEDYRDKIDDEGVKVIEIIVNNGQRMGRLIDDLLEFSRTSRKDLIRSKIHMEGMARAISEELMRQDPARKVEWIIHPLAPAEGDAGMMKQVWINLLSNAIKYTRKIDVSKIEVGCITDEHETTYYVKDNGVGFSMSYYDKLFGVFQRLHSMEDFEGTGVGLALVRRIIERHGGRTWAEAELNKGACFYFSIPKNNDVNFYMKH